jgi:hypothetical protein
MVMRIPLVGRIGAGLYAMVDDEDYEMLAGHRWRLDRGNHPDYAKTGREKVVRMHAMIMGVPRPDHIDGDGLNNQRSNLRAASPRQQQMNTKPKGGTSVYKGVSWLKWKSGSGGKWQASIRINGRLTYLGLFSDEVEAAQAYDAAAALMFGEFARLNFPERLS